MDYLGSVEELVLLAIRRLDGDAYGPRISDLVQARSIGALYTTLGRVESKGLIKSRLGKATAVRGGRAKTYYRLTPQGHRALRLAEQRRERVRRANQDVKAARKRRYCPNCGVEITSTDLQVSYCTNCKVKL